MTHTFTVSPDFSPDYLAGWFVFNTWLQRTLDCPFHLELMNDFQSLHRAIEADRIDLIYANPYDAAMLVRDKAFTPVVKPRNRPDEVVIAVLETSDLQAVEDLPKGVRIASTDDPDVHLIGMVMLEPSGLVAEDIELKVAGNYVLVAKQLLQGACDAGIFLDRAFHELSRPVRDQLRPLVRSDIQVIHHSLMAGPRLNDRLGSLRDALLDMENDVKGQDILTQLGLSAWEKVAPEETEFMIDLMETLTYSSLI
ncbi:MAG: phosphate/phosphite/phosphonate ABC transporter substrate-binding protein [Methylohalobius sp. ZOD2]